jgi:hypothetical protein
MGTAGSAYMDFRRALETGNLTLIESAARALPQVPLADSLEVLVVMADQNDGRFHRAAARWAGRAISEQQLNLEESRRVLALVEVMLTAPHAVAGHLRDYL